MRKQKKALFNSALSLLLCFSMLLGTTWAWFTDSVTSTNNIIKSGKLDVEMHYCDTNSADENDWKDASQGAIFDYQYWEPGFTQIKYVKIDNVGNLAFRYVLNIIPNTMPAAGEANLADVIDVYLVDTSKGDITRETLAGLTPVGTLSALMADSNGAARGVMLPVEGTTNVTLNESDKTIAQTGTATYCIALKMQEDAGNEYQDLTVGGGGFKVQLLATQYTYENDSFGNDYDADSEWPVPGLKENANGSADVETSNGVTTSNTTITTNTDVKATVPAGVAVDGDTLTLTVEEKDSTDSGLTTGTNEELMALDVHIAGVSENNTTPIVIALGKVLPVGMNLGNVALYHVEDGTTNVMTQVDTLAEVDAHNEFYYDPATGEVTVAMATFSEIAMTVATEAAWEGNVATAFSGGAGTEKDPYIIANADQLAYLGDRISNDNDNYGGKHYKLIADVNFGGDTVLDENGKLKFYPIGYTSEGYKGAFSGTFDGAGHTISNIYQNTWMLLGTYDGTYYNAAMGLFGYVYGGTVKNLTVDNFNSEGEFAPTGCVAAYAANATFENIAITNCHPQTYNTSVAAVVGRDGKNGLNDNGGYNLIFKNITVDSSNTVSALWGSWDVGAAGLLGYLGSDSKVLFENCNEAATIDVYNDVCGNYQYYWYRYCGAYIGTVNKRLDNGKGALDLSNVTAKNCTVDFGDRHEYYYCEFEKNTVASYTDDFQFSRVDHSQLNMDTSPVTCKHTHTANEDKQAVYIPFRQLFGGYGWGVDGVDEYENIDIKTLTNEDKFKKNDALSGDFLYRVGNGNAFPVGKLFQAIDENLIVDSGVYVSVKSLVEGVNMVGTFVKNESDWTQSTLHITGGTGPAKLTIQDYNNCNEFNITVEVVNAKNHSDGTISSLNGNTVLLCNTKLNSGGSLSLSGASLYGNGFEIDMTDGTYAAGGNTSSNYVFNLANANLDNVKLVGAVYTTYGATVQSEYNRAAVLSSGNSTITNSYVANCASAVRVKDGNLEIVNSTIKGGCFANIDIRGGHVILDNVTTINQVNGNDTAEGGTVVVGLGIAIYYENVLNTTTLDVKNTLTQYNVLSKTQAENYIKDSTARTMISTVYGSGYSNIQYKDSDGEIWVNGGILSMSADIGDDNITDVSNYEDKTVTALGNEGYLHTPKPTAESVTAGAHAYVTAGQGAIAPGYSFDYTTKNYKAKTDGSNDYCYQADGMVYISMDAGDTFEWDTSILTATKNGQTLDYTVSMNGTNYTDKRIAFNTAGNYEVKYTYNDSNNYGMNAEGNITTYSKTYEKTVHISVAVIEAATKHAEFTFGSSNAATEKITVDNATYISATGVTADNSTWTYMTIGDKKIYYPIVAAKLTSTKGSSSYAYFPVFENVVTITDYADNGTGDAFTYNSSTTTLPSTLTAVKGVYKAASDVPYWYNLTNSNLTQSGASKIFKWASSSDAPSDPTTYNNVLCYKSPQVSADRVAYITLVQYSYTDATNTTYYYYVGYTLEAFTKQTTCVTPDTLVTLADGTQKRIDQATYADEFLVWDFVKGEYTTAPASIVMNHGYNTYDVVTLNFADGTVVNTINGHGFYEADDNEFVILSENNAAKYIGREFVKQDGTVTALVSYDVKQEETESWSILTAEHYNCILEGMFTLTPAEVEGSPDYLMPFAIGEDMKYDEAAMQSDIEKYGLYIYEDFADYMTYEQFAALNLPIFKVAVGKGYITYDEIMYLISIHINP